MQKKSAWLKLNPFIEVCLEIKATEEGTGRNVGKLGALICEGVDDGKKIKTNVGSGLSDDNRDQFWKNKDKLIGQIVEVRADAITKNQDSEDEYSLRFPRFMRFRGFDLGENMISEYEAIQKILDSTQTDIDDIEYGGECFDELMDYFQMKCPWSKESKNRYAR